MSRSNTVGTNRYQWMVVAAAGVLVLAGINSAEPPQTETTAVVDVEPITPDAPPSNADPVTGVEPKGPTIVMASLKGCGPCAKWWGEKDAWEDVGWEVKRVYKTPGVKRFPTFRIFHKGRWYQHVGYLGYDQAADLLGLDRPRRSAQQTSSGLRTHLMGPNHGFQRAQLRGMTHDELEALHTRHHMQKQTMGVSRVYSNVSSSSCNTCSSGLFGLR